MSGSWRLAVNEIMSEGTLLPPGQANVDLSGQLGTPAAVKKLATELSTNSTVRRISFDKINMDDAAILKLQNALSQNYTLVSFGGVGKMPLWKATDGASGTTHGRAAALSNIASSLVLNNNQTLATAKSHVASDGSSKPGKGKGKSKPKSKYAPNRMITGF